MIAAGTWRRSNGMISVELADQAPKEVPPPDKPKKERPRQSPR